MDISPFSGQSANPHAGLLATLMAEMPEIFSEGKIDPQKLRATLGEEVFTDNERYGLGWNGKADCFKKIQETTTNTLRPCREESVDFDHSENLFIEGDNLQALKVLQKSYYGQVKMIYIDPPYNTGKDFIYSDRFSRTKKEELIANGSIDEYGNVVNHDLYRQNTRDSGHFHSNWLTMMYPRLFLAKNLLKKDGVIFVSIDDNEVKNLRGIMDEIFGEENFEGQIHWRRRHNQPNDRTKLIGIVAEHILVYSKNAIELKQGGVGKLDLTGKFSNPDNDPRGDWNSKPWKVGANQSGSRYTIMSPTGVVFDEEWMGEETTYKSLVADNRIYFPKNGNGIPRKKIFYFEREEEGQCATNWFPHEQFGSNQNATDEFASLMDGNKMIFENPKPTRLISDLVRLGDLKQDGIVLDFFAGSGTAAHAVMQLNAEDGGNRKWICVQLPEKCKQESEAAKAGFVTIADIAKERIRRAGKKLQEEHEGRGLDAGFKVFKLAESNFKVWNTQIESVEQLEQQLLDFVDNVRPETRTEDLLYELILKSGLELNVVIEEKAAAGDKYHRIGDGRLIICLADTLTQPLLQAILQDKPEKIIVLDRAFSNNDQLKTNMLLEAEQAGVKEFNVI